MTSPPVIGVCAAWEQARWGLWDQPAAIISRAYIHKLRAAGGVPVGLVPDPHVVADPQLLLDRIDGLLLIGGADVDPAFYRSERDPLTESTVPERDAFEIALATAALAGDRPVLGICRGLQILNVATGGTLHQDLRQAGFGEHRATPGRLDAMHDIAVLPNTLAAGIAGDGRREVNHHHHQGVADLGAGAAVTARSLPDHLPEALEWPACHYALGVQWHPEAIELTHVLTEFVHAAARHRPDNG